MSAELIRTVAKANEQFAQSHKPSITFEQFPDMKGAIVLSCMDPRANPTDFWHLGEDGPAVVRNGGGRVTEDTLRSMRTLAGIMSYGRNTLGVVAVIHHTDCGLSHFSNERVGELLAERAGLDGERAKDVSTMDFGSWAETAANPEESVRKDMEAVKRDPYLPKGLEVVGFVYDVFTGTTKEVHALN